jgi:vacuolar protein sorting-associated protein 35
MEDDQDKLLNEAVNVVKQEAVLMQRAIETRDLEEVLKHASTMISELRTQVLSPRNYYQLYMTVFDEMRYLENFFMEEYRSGRKMAYLYEKVQNTGFILPRLYLLITVGSVYIQTRELPASSVLKDLIEMVKGVQHPMRGLFLRYYLNKVCKDKLPDVGNEYEGEGGSVDDSIDFLVTNLSEMNRLWVRMQHTGSVRDKTKREKERNDLRVTVGENIVRLANLQGTDISRHERLVLPKVLEIVTSSKDVISQQYLMDCIIQAFPDDFHLKTLETILEACTQLQPTVDIKSVFINLMDRLSNYAGESQGDLEIVQEKDIFSLFKGSIDKLVAEQAEHIETKRLLELEVAFMRFSMKCYPMSTSNVNSILDSCVKLLQTKNETLLDGESLKNVVKLLSFPLETLSLSILTMNHYPKLMKYLTFLARKQVAYKIAQAVVRSRKALETPTIVEELFQFIGPLLKDHPDTVKGEDYEFDDEQSQVARLVHLVSGSDAQSHFEILKTFKAVYDQGGDERIAYTFPALTFALIKFVQQRSQPDQIEEVLGILLQLVTKMRSINPELALRLNLQCVACIQSADPQRRFEELIYDFASEALLIYEDEISTSESKQAALQVISGTLIGLKYFSDDNYETLITNTAQYCARLLKKQDQCASIVQCTHLFWNETSKHERRVTECLKKAVKIADICSSNPQNVWLFVHIFNKYLYFYSANIIDSSTVNSLVELIAEHLSRTEDTPATGLARQYLRATVRYLKLKQEKGEMTDIRAFS